MAKMSKEIQMRIHNRFDIEVVDSRTGKVRQKVQAENIICNNMWDYLCRSSSLNATDYIHYGSGSGTPSESDASLFNMVGAKSATEVSTNVNHTTGVVWRIVNITIGTTEAVGVNITEIGLAMNQNNGYLTTHAMLQDMNGNPISIAKTDTDVINVYATVYAHISNFNDSGLQIWFQQHSIRGLTGGPASFLNQCQIGVMKNNVLPANDNHGNTSVYTFNKSYNLSNKTVTFSRRIEVSEGNLLGVGWLVGGGSYWTGFGVRCGTNGWSVFSKTGESVGIGDGSTTKFKTKFSFPYNPTVYINGNAVSSGVTVKKLPCDTDGYFTVLDASSTDNHWVEKPCQRDWGATDVLYNKMYNEGNGISRITFYGYPGGTHNLYCSNDMVNWTRVAQVEGIYYLDFDIPAQYQNSKYFSSRDDYMGWLVSSAGNQDGYNIIFDTPPANGDVITIDYDTECIPKDGDHVIDVAITIQFGAYQGE